MSLDRGEDRVGLGRISQNKSKGFISEAMQVPHQQLGQFQRWQTQKAMEATSAFGASPHVVLTRVASVASDGGPEAVDRRVHRGSDPRQSCGGRLVDQRMKSWPRAQ